MGPPRYRFQGSATVRAESVREIASKFADKTNSTLRSHTLIAYACCHRKRLSPKLSPELSGRLAVLSKSSFLRLKLGVHVGNTATLDQNADIGSSRGCRDLHGRRLQ